MDFSMFFLAKISTKQGGGEIKWDFFFLILKIC